MKLTAFRIKNFRSVNDSGWIDVDKRTALVGRNESGKTNLLLALASLNPPGGVQALSKVKDFPRDRPFSDFDAAKTIVVRTKWDLTASEQDELADVYPAHRITNVMVSRNYKGTRYVDLKLPPPTLPTEAVSEHFDALERSLNASLRTIQASARESVKEGFAGFRRDVEAGGSPKTWGGRTMKSVEKFEGALRQSGLSLSEAGSAELAALQDLGSAASADEKQRRQARAWIFKQLPPLVYTHDYPALQGHQDVPAYLNRLEDPDEEPTPSDREFEKLMKVAGLDAEILHELLSEDHEARQQMANRAGAVVTKKVQELWTDRELKIRFNLDAEHFDTFVSDSTSTYDVEINLDERSLGFRWFFSFYIGFTADTQGGDKDKAVLLLDEPGLHLHAIAQGDLLDHFKEDFRNQILFTTHSPFMIPVDDLKIVRTVNIDPGKGTTVTNDPTGDSATLFPLQTALGYTLTQSLFVGPASLVIEGVTDFWYLSAVMAHLEDLGEETLPEDMVLTPAGGAQKVPYMVSLLASQRMNVVVLLDGEEAARETAHEDLVKTKLIRERDVLFVPSAFESGEDREKADIEDLLDPEVFGALVRESYAKELEGKELKLNEHIPRIVTRYAHAFEDLGMEFHKTRPARLFLDKMGSDPASVLPESSQARFSRLFATVRERREAQRTSGETPFTPRVGQSGG